MPKKMTQEEFIHKAKLIHGDKYDYSLVIFRNVRGKIKIKIDDVIYEQFAYAHLKGKCPENAPFKMTTIEFIERAKTVHGNKYDYSQTKINGNKNKVVIIFNGKKYEQSPIDHIRGNNPRGTNVGSKGVNKIEEILNKKQIEYSKEFTFIDCKNINYLPFDFYLSKYNILIEFDGKQHFMENSFFGGKEEFTKRLHNDNIKNKYAQKNKIPLLRIPYFDFENIENILSEFISIHNTSSYDKSY